MKRFLDKLAKQESRSTKAESLTLNPATTEIFPVGVLVLSDPSEATLDICFIHGLTGDRTSTWTAQGQSQPWPQTLLPTEIPKARILTYGYDAYVVRPPVDSSNKLKEHALDLLTDITDLRSNHPERPLVFVCHSLGGLVCKRAILLSQTNAGSRWGALYPAVHGIIFMGTPHQGNWMADWSKIPARGLGISKSTNKDLLRVLQTNDEFLKSLHGDFVNMLRHPETHVRRRLKITCFFETLPLPPVGFVVSQSSATFEGYNLRSIHANHSDMVKFSSTEDAGFHRVLAELRRWRNEISLVSSTKSGVDTNTSRTGRVIGAEYNDSDSKSLIDTRGLRTRDRRDRHREVDVNVVLPGPSGDGRARSLTSERWMRERAVDEIDRDRTRRRGQPKFEAEKASKEPKKLRQQTPDEYKLLDQVLEERMLREEESKDSTGKPRTQVGLSQDKSVSYYLSERSWCGPRRGSTMFTKRRVFSRKLSESRSTFENKSLAAAWHHWPDKLEASPASTPLPLAYETVDQPRAGSYRLAALMEYAQVLFDAWPSTPSSPDVEVPVTALAYDSTRNVVSVMKVSRSSILVLQKLVQSFIDRGNIWKVYEESQAATISDVFVTGGDLSLLIKQWDGDPQDLFRYVQMRLQAIDLAVMSHLYAHAPRVLYDSREDPIHIPATSLLYTTLPTQNIILFKPYRLACLDGLTRNRKVWVFHLQSEEPQEPLYLSSSVKDFAAIWGPIWNVPTPHDNALIDHLNVGGGQLYPVADNDGPRLLGKERRCHWRPEEAEEADVEDANSISSKDSEPDRSTPRHLRRLREADPLRLDEHLLIGATENTNLTWYACYCSMSMFRSKMRGEQRLHPLRSRGWHSYVSSTSLGLDLGTSGVVMSGTATRQIDEGQNMKQGFLEEWENSPRSWDPRDLMDFRGVLVSACTFNARRVRLVELFKTDTLLSLLARCHFSNETIRTSLTTTLIDADPFALVTLWEDKPEWQQDMGNAILVCIRALCKSGYDKRNDIFNVLWKPPREHKFYRLELDPEQHRWIRFLKESEDSMTMAVLVEDQLATRRLKPCGRRDGRPSVLETAIMINESLSPAEYLEKTKSRKFTVPSPWRSVDKPWKYVWRVRSVPHGTSLLLAETKRLKAVQSLSDTHLLLEQNPSLMRLIKDNLRIKSGRKDSHWEYGSDNSDDDSAGGDVRPIPVHIR